MGGKYIVKRSIRTVLAIAMCVALVGSLSACAPASSTSKSTGAKTVAPAKIRIGTLPTEDVLPLWVAEKNGLFKKAGLDVTITTFQSAQERDAALTAGAVDGTMGDLIAAASLRAGGVPVKVATIMLGATPQQGRFGIVVKPGSKVTSLKELAGVPVGTSSASIQEYVLDELMQAAGVPVANVKKEEVKKVPVRFELLMSGKLAAAALPEPFISLAEKSGAKVIADDTTGANISQTVLIFSQKYLDDPAGSAAVSKLLGVWDIAAAAVNKNPALLRGLLVEKARLPQSLADNYKVNTYPIAQLPTPAEVATVLTWMKSEKLLKVGVTYPDLMWNGPVK